MHSIIALPLHYTPFLFGTVSLHASAKGVYLSQFLFLWLMAFSILHHAKNHESYYGKTVVDNLDKLIAHLVVAHSCFTGLLFMLAHGNNPVPLIGSLAPTIIGAHAFYISKINFHPIHGSFYHALTCHVIPALGYHITLLYAPPSTPSFNNHVA